MTAESKELLDLARRCAAGDAQSAELLQRLAAECTQLRRYKLQLEQSNERMVRLVGLQTDELALLREELGGDGPAREHVRKAAYAVVQRDMVEAGVIEDFESLIEAVDAAAKEPR